MATVNLLLNSVKTGDYTLYGISDTPCFDNYSTKQMQCHTLWWNPVIHSQAQVAK